MIVIYIIPLRYLVIAWGLKKFSKALRSGVENNEVKVIILLIK